MSSLPMKSVSTYGNESRVAQANYALIVLSLRLGPPVENPERARARMLSYLSRRREVTVLIEETIETHT